MDRIMIKTNKSHKYDEQCKYCSNLLARRSYVLWDEVIFESENFVVTPTLGSILPGWLLIIPKFHVLNYSLIAQEYFDEYLGIKWQAKNLLERSFGPVTEFEHGPKTNNSLAGCGINHAHVHLISIEFELNDAIKEFHKIEYIWEKVSETEPLTNRVIGDNDYLTYVTPNGTRYLALVDKPISQYFRQVIANRTGCLDKFDYNKFPFDENVNKTLSLMSEVRKIA